MTRWWLTDAKTFWTRMNTDNGQIRADKTMREMRGHATIGTNFALGYPPLSGFYPCSSVSMGFGVA